MKAVMILPKKCMTPAILLLFKKTLNILNERDISVLNHLVNVQAVNIKLGLLNKTKLLTATSELVRNMLTYAGSGKVVVETISQDSINGIKITFIDEGPGIPDVALVMTDGYSSRNTLGLGLPGAKRLVDEFLIMSEVNKGTTITITKWANG
jgi:serine/threonine-protein kinase RsbT